MTRENGVMSIFTICLSFEGRGGRYALFSWLNAVSSAKRIPVSVGSQALPRSGEKTVWVICADPSGRAV